MKVTIESEDNIPGSVDCALSADFLNELFLTILPDDNLRVSNEWFENTSDVLIARSSFGSVDRIHNWTLRQIAVDRSRIARIRELLVSEGVSKLRSWFAENGATIHEEPSRWVCYSITVRFENDSLMFIENTSLRPDPRPEQGWPKERYRPSTPKRKID